MNEIDEKRKAPTIDEVLNNKLDPIVEQINSVNENLIDDFNKAFNNTYKDINLLREELVGSIKLLWSFLNEANIRSAALESVLIKNGLDPNDIMAEVIVIKEQYKEQGMEEFDISSLMQKSDKADTLSS